MRKLKNQSGKKDLEHDAVIDLTAAEAAAPAMGRKITVEKKVFSRPITLKESEEAEESPEDPTDDAFDDLDTFGADELSSDLLNFFDADSGDEGHRLRVFQMIKPSAGAKFTKGGTIFRGEMPYTPTFLRDVQETFGGGVFRLQVVGEQTNETTGRTRFGILKSKTVTISAPPMPKVSLDDPMSSPVNPSYAQNSHIPQVPYFIQPPSPSGESLPQKTMKDELREVVEIVTMVDTLRGHRDEPTPAPTIAPPIDPEVVLLQNLANNDKFMDRVTNGLMGKVLGEKIKDDEPWYAEAVKDAVKSGQAVEIVKVGIEMFFKGIKGLFPGGQNNGQAQMVTAPLQASGTADSQRPHDGGDDQTQTQPQIEASVQSINGATDSESGMLPTANLEEQYLNHILTYVIQECIHPTPAGAVVDNIFDYIEDDVHPFYRTAITRRLQMFGSMPVDSVLEFVKGLPNGETVVALPHAKEWTEQLQKLIRESQEGGEE